MSQLYKTLLFETDEQGLCVITINRPDKMNALNNQVLDELSAAVRTVSEAKAIRALILTGTGDKAFVAGADIAELNALDAENSVEASKKGQRIFQQIEDLNIPVIAAVNGYALGGGCELAMACHIRVAAPNAVFGLPEVSLGLIPGYGGTQRLPMLVGKAKALELILTGRFAKAEEALTIGLVNKIAETSALEDARAMVGAMLKQGPVAIGMAIQAVRKSGSEQGYNEEANLFGKLFSTSDFKEGTSAFLEKRKPNFSGN